MEFTRTGTWKTKYSALKSALYLCVLVSAVACSHSTRSLFFDIPPPDTKPEAEPASSQGGGEQGSIPTIDGAQFLHPHDLDTDRPPLEDIRDWDKALQLLPKDEEGNADWVKAQNDGTIKPRAMNPRDRNGDAFRLDFYLKNDKPKFEAYFPHSAHVTIMGCDSCHPAIFRYRDNEITMKTMRKGENCGTCHGTVAFSTKNCKRCHTSM